MFIVENYEGIAKRWREIREEEDRTDDERQSVKPRLMADALRTLREQRTRPLRPLLPSRGQ